MKLKKKVISIESAFEISRILKKENKSVGLCHGCFDLMHVGHVRHFRTASNECDYLFVSVTPDRFVNKGPDRPVIKEEDRALMVASLENISFSFINSYDSAVKLIDRLKPTFFFKGIEYKNNPDLINPNFLKELNVLEKNGGKMIFTSDEIRSSTSIINKLKTK